MTTAYFICIILFAFADVAHLVERHLAKVEVASSSLVIRSTYAPVAQLDRVSGYEPEGQGFESLPARQSRVITFVVDLFFCCIEFQGLEPPLENNLRTHPCAEVSNIWHLETGIRRPASGIRHLASILFLCHYFG